MIGLLIPYNHINRNLMTETDIKGGRWIIVYDYKYMYERRLPQIMARTQAIFPEVFYDFLSPARPELYNNWSRTALFQIHLPPNTKKSRYWRSWKINNPQKVVNAEKKLTYSSNPGKATMLRASAISRRQCWKLQLFPGDIAESFTYFQLNVTDQVF
jgi:hypothetical protein